MKRILVVDDDPELQQVLALMLDEHGYQVQIAGNGDEAIEEIRRGVPDLMLIDLVMPGRDGFSVMRELARRGIRVPTIVMTAMGGITERLYAEELGALDYVAKPFQVNDLIERIANALPRKAGAA